MDKKEILKWISIVFLILAAIYFVMSVGGVTTGNVVSDDPEYIDSEEVLPEVYGENSPSSHDGEDKGSSGCSYGFS